MKSCASFSLSLSFFLSLSLSLSLFFFFFSFFFFFFFFPFFFFFFFFFFFCSFFLSLSLMCSRYNQVTLVWLVKQLMLSLKVTARLLRLVELVHQSIYQYIYFFLILLFRVIFFFFSFAHCLHTNRLQCDPSIKSCQ